MSLVERIRELASQKKTNIKNIEVSTGLGNGTIRRWDDVSPSIDKLIKVADFLNVSLDYLAVGKDPLEVLKKEDREWLELIHSLSPETQRDFKGAMRLHRELHSFSQQEDSTKDMKQAK